MRYTLLAAALSLALALPAHAADETPP
ncbi:MAG: hypothetical protein RIR00_1464, partial [Pseudomonadota bacterium]